MKDREPGDTQEGFFFISRSDFERALSRAGLPSPLQWRVMREMPALAPEEILGVLLGNLPEEKKEELERRGVAGLEQEIRESVTEEVGGSFDEYLREVARRVFGFSLADLSGQERREIESVRQDLKIPGIFNPDGKQE